MVVPRKKIGIFNVASSFHEFWNTKILWEWTWFNRVFSRDNLPKKIKDGVYVINLDEYADTGTHWIVLFCKKNEIIYFDSFGVEHISEEIKEFIGNKNITANIFRVQGFINFMLAGKTLINFTNLFSLHDLYDSIILSYFKDAWNR